MLLAEIGGRIRLEGQRELDGGVVELGDRRERHMQSRRYASEREANGESILFHLEVPEAVLDDDGHFVGEFLGEMLGDRNARQPRLEGDVEVMPAGQSARLLNFP